MLLVDALVVGLPIIFYLCNLQSASVNVANQCSLFKFLYQYLFIPCVLVAAERFWECVVKQWALPSNVHVCYMLLIEYLKPGIISDCLILHF